MHKVGRNIAHNTFQCPRLRFFIIPPLGQHYACLPILEKRAEVVFCLRVFDMCVVTAFSTLYQRQRN